MKRLLPLFFSLGFICFIALNVNASPFALKPVKNEENTVKQKSLDDLKAEMKDKGISLTKKQRKKLQKKKAKLRKKLARKGIDPDELDTRGDVLDEPYFRLGLICILAALALSLVGNLLLGLGGIFLWLSGILALVGVILLILGLLQVV